MPSKERWIELVNKIHRLMSVAGQRAKNRLSDLLMSGANPNCEEAKDLKRIANRCDAIFRCNKYRNDKETKWTCKNPHFCDNCNRRMRLHLAKQVGKYLAKAKNPRLYAYVRKEDFLLPKENTDWDQIKKKCIPFLIKRRNRLFVNLNRGTAQCLGCSSKIEVINNPTYKDYISVRLTTLLVFDECRIYSMSEYWKEKDVFEVNSDGVPTHIATLQYMGIINSESRALKVLNKVFPSRLYTYALLGSDVIINIFKVFSNIQTWNQFGPVFNQRNKSGHKTYRDYDRNVKKGKSLYKDDLYDLSD